MPVLNFSADPASQVPQWRETLTAYHLHTCVQFDAVAPFMGAERQLYEDLGVLLRERRVQLQAIVDNLDLQAFERRQAASQIVASLLVSAAAMRRPLPQADLAEPARKAALLHRFKKSLAALVEAGVQDVLAVYGFRPGDADVDLAPWSNGRWEDDLFNAQTLKDASQKMGTGAAVGAAVGLVADMAVAGLSLGAATALGAAVGGLASQGWSQVPRKIANRVRGIGELTLENDVLLVLADSLLRLCAVLEQRGHAALAKVHVAAQPGRAHDGSADDGLRALIASLAPARSYAHWELAPHAHTSGDARRSQCVERAAQRVRQVLQLQGGH